MQTGVRKFAHFLERTGLAMAGAACGLFVAAHVGSSVAWLTNQGFLLFMMLVGAVGTFLATLTAFVSVGVIVSRETPEIFWTVVIMLGWMAGVVMQIIAGGIASMRAS